MTESSQTQNESISSEAFYSNGKLFIIDTLAFEIDPFKNGASNTEQNDYKLLIDDPKFSIAEQSMLSNSKVFSPTILKQITSALPDKKEDIVAYKKIITATIDTLGTNKSLKRKNDQNQCNVTPITMRDLSSGLQKVFYKFTQSNQASLPFMGFGNAKIGKKEVILVVDFIQFKNTTCNNRAIRYGVGARLFLTIVDLKAGINISNLPQLAAAVEFGRANVSYTLSTVGIVGESIIDALPTGSEFDVENYSKIVSGIDNIVRMAKDDTKGVYIEPQVIPVFN